MVYVYAFVGRSGSLVDSLPFVRSSRLEEALLK